MEIIIVDVLVSWKSWKSDLFLFSTILEILGAGGRLLWVGFPGLDYFWNIVPGIYRYPGYIGNLRFMDFSGFHKNRRAPENHAEPSGVHGEVSHMRPIQG